MTASLVFADAWSWTAVVLVPAVAAAVVCAVRRRWPQALLLAVLALSALLAPADQARIQTTTSLNKHVDFGAWFAAIAAGYLLSMPVQEAGRPGSVAGRLDPGYLSGHRPRRAP